MLRFIISNTNPKLFKIMLEYLYSDRVRDRRVLYCLGDDGDFSSGVRALINDVVQSNKQKSFFSFKFKCKFFKNNSVRTGAC